MTMSSRTRGFAAVVLAAVALALGWWLRDSFSTSAAPARIDSRLRPSQTQAARAVAIRITCVNDTPIGAQDFVLAEFRTVCGEVEGEPAGATVFVAVRDDGGRWLVQPALPDTPGNWFSVTTRLASPRGRERRRVELCAFVTGATVPSGTLDDETLWAIALRVSRPVTFTLDPAVAGSDRASCIAITAIEDQPISAADPVWVRSVVSVDGRLEPPCSGQVWLAYADPAVGDTWQMLTGTRPEPGGRWRVPMLVLPETPDAHPRSRRLLAVVAARRPATRQLTGQELDALAVARSPVVRLMVAAGELRVTRITDQSGRIVFMAGDTAGATPSSVRVADLGEVEIAADWSLQVPPYVVAQLPHSPAFWAFGPAMKSPGGRWIVSNARIAGEPHSLADNVVIRAVAPIEPLDGRVLSSADLARLAVASSSPMSIARLPSTDLGTPQVALTDIDNVRVVAGGAISVATSTVTVQGNARGLFGGFVCVAIRPGGALRYTFECSRAPNETGWRLPVDLYSGIRGLVGSAPASVELSAIATREDLGSVQAERRWWEPFALAQSSSVLVHLPGPSLLGRAARMLPYAGAAKEAVMRLPALVWILGALITCVVFLARDRRFAVARQARSDARHREIVALATTPCEREISASCDERIADLEARSAKNRARLECRLARRKLRERSATNDLERAKRRSGHRDIPASPLRAWYWLALLALWLGDSALCRVAFVIFREPAVQTNIFASVFGFAVLVLAHRIGRSLRQSKSRIGAVVLGCALLGIAWAVTTVRTGYLDGVAPGFVTRSPAMVAAFLVINLGFALAAAILAYNAHPSDPVLAEAHATVERCRARVARTAERFEAKRRALEAACARERRRGDNLKAHYRTVLYSHASGAVKGPQDTEPTHWFTGHSGNGRRRVDHAKAQLAGCLTGASDGGLRPGTAHAKARRGAR
jgi:hypothetical protein